MAKEKPVESLFNGFFFYFSSSSFLNLERYIRAISPPYCPSTFSNQYPNSGLTDKALQFFTQASTRGKYCSPPEPQAAWQMSLVCSGTAPHFLISCNKISGMAHSVANISGQFSLPQHCHHKQLRPELILLFHPARRYMCFRR